MNLDMPQYYNDSVEPKLTPAHIVDNLPFCYQLPTVLQYYTEKELYNLVLYHRRIDNNNLHNYQSCFVKEVPIVKLALDVTSGKIQ